MMGKIRGVCTLCGVRSQAGDNQLSPCSNGHTTWLTVADASMCTKKFWNAVKASNVDVVDFLSTLYLTGDDIEWGQHTAVAEGTS